MLQMAGDVGEPGAEQQHVDAVTVVGDRVEKVQQHPRVAIHRARDVAQHDQTWARRSLRSSGVVIVVSDGWDRGDPAIVAAETARLRRNCHRLVWLNPLAGTPGYQPLAGGMRAAYPYIDDFLPAGTVASLERLGEILGGVRSADTRRGSEAAAHAALPGVAEAAEAATAAGTAPPAVLVGEPTDRGTARPIR